MNLLKKTLKELLYVRGIKQPFKYLGEGDYKELFNSKCNMAKTKRRSTMNKLARKLNVPASFIKRIMEYERIDE